MIPKHKLKYWEFFMGKLKLETPLHITSGEISLETDAAILQTAGGRIYIPGTSMAGALRARAQEFFEEEELIDLIFGYQERDNKSHRSRIFVEDAYADRATTSIRDGVAIDRRCGSASEGAKYDLEITPKNLEFPLLIKLEIREGDDEAKMRQLVFCLVEDLREGRIKLGGGKSRGLGRCTFEYEHRRLDFGDPAQVSAYLCGRDINNLFEVPHGDPSDPAGILSPREEFEELDCSIEMEIKDVPFLIKDGGWDDDFDAIFTRCLESNDNLSDYIPGSSIKGVIRAHAERILRTLGADVCDILDQQNSCNANVKTALKEDDKGGKPEEDDRVRIIRENSCPICRLFGNSHLAGRIRFDDAFFESPPPKKKLDHVAIDRFTGGAMDGKLFNEQPAIGGKTTIHFTVRNPTPFDKCLLAFLMRDLMDGFPPMRFGYGKTKGYGRLQFLEATINSEPIKENGELKSFLGIVSTENWWTEERTNG